jgi:hypothetical protein
VSLERPPEFVGKDSGAVGRRKPRGGIEVDIPDLVAEIARNAFCLHSLDRKRIGVIRGVDTGRGKMAGAAIACVVRIVKPVPRSVIWLSRDWRERRFSAARY